MIITEKDLDACVRDLARLGGWRIYHTFDSRRSSAGFPDLVLLRPPRLVFVELKSDRGRVSDEQSAWLDDLEQCGVEAYIWRPDDWPERISKMLSRNGGPAK